ncbi:unnamed protein product [Adineta steineri]|uniref:DEP domain-containing protein n=1 Tax=Adineta steineri TaxID=433720 RepID=A0A814QMH7_9BILA|nr:unnamed protein product [Adineta steineri]CAF1122669.1 unnamed protein product [Adineta steineri]
MASATIKPKKQSFHATNVWNELVSSFRSKIELKKYRRNYFTQTYEQCFSSADAINCMINILKIHPNFETKQIEKHHAIRLLEKFYESKVFTDVIKTERKKTFVVENGIYQLLSKADENIFQSVLNTNKVPDQQIHSPQESSSSSAMSDSWKQYFLERLEKYLLKTRNRHGGYLLHQIEQELKLIDGSQILSNLHNNMPTDPLTIAGQLVDWLPESMSIVINFPSSLDGRNLPDYPSFIFDLFEMVIDTFEMQKQYLSSSMTIFNLIIQLIANKGNPTTMETLYDRDDGRSVYCFPSEIYAGRSINNPYTTLKNRSCYTKQTSRVHRVDSYDYKKIPSHDDDKSYGLTNLRRKSLSSCDLFHVTSKTLSSPFDEIHNWLNNKYTTSTNQDKMSSDEFELIQLALIHLTTSNRQYIYVILYFLTKCIQNNEFCSSDTIKLRIYRSFTKLITINSDENTCFNTIFDCFIEYYGKLFDISMDTKKAVSRRLTKLKKENKPVNLTSVTTTNKKSSDDRQLRQTFKQLRVSRPLTYNEHLDNDVNSMPSTKFARKPFLHSPSHQSNEKTCLTTISTNSPRRRARSFEPRAHATTLFDKTINPFHKLRVILKRND